MTFSGIFGDAVTAAAPAEESAPSIEEKLGYFQALCRRTHGWCAAERENLIAFLGGTAVTVIAALAVYVAVKFTVSRLARRFPESLLLKIIGRLNAPVCGLILLTGFSLSNKLVNFPGRMDLWIDKSCFALFLFVALWGVFRALGVIETRFRQRVEASGSRMNRLLIDLVRRATLVTVWTLAAIFIAQNLFQLNVTALLTGAGVAGLAIAFAAQNTVANLFGAVSIITDKVFQIGDRVVIGDMDGFVEEVGFRSTRLRALDGTTWNIPNRIAADGTIQNITSRTTIRHVFTLNLTYGTTPEKMRRALEILQEIFAAHPGLDMEKCPPVVHFSDFAAYSLDIGVVLRFQTTDWGTFIAWKQALNFSILERFNAEGLEFAFPTSTNYLIKQGEA